MSLPIAPVPSTPLILLDVVEDTIVARCTWAEFLADNDGILDAHPKLAKLRPGEAMDIGGGAAPLVKVYRDDLTDEEIARIASEALNAACLEIQLRLGVEDGGWAGQWFSGGEAESQFAAYIRSEVAHVTDADEEAPADEWVAICTCGSWPKRTSGPSNVAHSDDCGLLADEGLVSEGVAITDPTLDETGRFPVGPNYYATDAERIEAIDAITDLSDPEDLAATFTGMVDDRVRAEDWDDDPADRCDLCGVHLRHCDHDPAEAESQFVAPDTDADADANTDDPTAQRLVTTCGAFLAGNLPLNDLREAWNVCATEHPHW